LDLIIGLYLLRAR